jgi:hypothetical protein
MSKYAYQIQGALEGADGRFKAFRVFVCTNYNFGTVDVPSSIFDKETTKYIEFRLKVSERFIINRLPATVQSNIRIPLGNWLDDWVLNLIYGNTGDSQNIHPGLLEDGTRLKDW